MELGTKLADAVVVIGVAVGCYCCCWLLLLLLVASNAVATVVVGCYTDK